MSLEIVFPGGREMRLGPDPTAQVLKAAVPHMRQAMMLVEAEVKQRAQRHRRTGTLMRSITSRVEHTPAGLVGTVGTALEYARYLEDGTGLYGPRNQVIRPKRGGVLAWPAKVGQGTSFTLAGRARTGASAQSVRSGMAFARWVRGIRPLRIFRDAQLVAEPKVARKMRLAGAEIARAILGGAR